MRDVGLHEPAAVEGWGIEAATEWFHCTTVYEPRGAKHGALADATVTTLTTALVLTCPEAIGFAFEPSLSHPCQTTP